jgi:hypothetical protein
VRGHESKHLLFLAVVAIRAIVLIFISPSLFFPDINIILNFCRNVKKRSQSYASITTPISCRTDSSHRANSCARAAINN